MSTDKSEKPSLPSPCASPSDSLSLSLSQRYEHTFSVSEKVEGRIDFPLSINMLPYTTKSQNKDVDKSMFIYDLSSVVVHKGKLDAGHYFAFCRQGDQVRSSS